MKYPEIQETERLVLKMPTRNDFQYYEEMLSDPLVSSFVNEDGAPYDQIMSWRNFCREVGEWTLQQMGLYSVFLKGSSEYVGRVGIRFPLGWPSHEIHWTLSSKYWGNGFAYEASRSCITNFKKYFGTTRQLVAVICEENVKSKALAEKLNFIDTGELFFFRHSLNIYKYDWNSN